MSFTCHSCGQEHDSLPMSYGTDAPAPWHDIPENERENRTELTSDLCMIDDQFFFIRGMIEIPVIDAKDVFAWTVWVSLSLQNFRRVVDLWDEDGREKEPPYFGWLCTLLPCYPETLHLKTKVHTRSVGNCPLIELEPTDHPLAVEQRQGITLDRVQQFAEQILHQ